MRRLALLGVLLSGVAVAGSPDEDERALYPFSPGEHAAEVKQVCASCHSATLVTGRRYDETQARRFIRLMLGGADAEQAERIVAYLTTMLAEEE
jgi:hypothetical protein